MNVLLTSAGRRNYLVQWFSQALARTGEPGRVYVADCDRRVPAQAAADGFIHLPGCRSAGYLTVLARECARYEISLLVPLHDHELSALAGEPTAILQAAGTRALTPGYDQHRAVEDKYSFSLLATAAGIATPDTRLGSELLSSSAGDDLGPELVVKHRYGNGSSGLIFCTAKDVPGHIRSSALTAPDEFGRPRSDGAAPDYDLVVVQPRIRGVEYGIDAVGDFDGRHLACLARRKLNMRAGETDRAVTVDPRPFSDTGRRIATAIGARGLIDIDAIVDAEGRSWVIDVNPRFGGGYPFNHLAGADVPACYVAWNRNAEHDPKWLVARPGVTGAKYEALTTVTGSDRD
ncbi:ATP-grasp domain-containing protein [Micromonospora rubida]|uniref:ATP-grasp domain-containing protein n=1 Tax=Micromonospora rubida TaxID=2697657 RepID=A0ABW7SNP7_9ACTN